MGNRKQDRVLTFIVYEGALNAAIFLKFLRRPVKDADRKLFVIVDNLRVYRAKVVMAWMAENADRIELFYCSAGAKPGRVSEKRRQTGARPAQHANGQDGDEGRAAITHAGITEAPGEGAILLPGPQCPLCSVTGKMIPVW